MNVELASFSDELEKIAKTVRGRTDINKGIVVRGLKGALVGAAGAGLGSGLGYLAMNIIEPKVFPKLTNSQMGKLSLVGAGIGMGAGIVNLIGMRKYRQLTDTDVKRG